VIAVVNSFNLFDNMDGAASAMALVVSAGVCVLAVVIGDVWVAVGSAALCGACLGFLPHNLSSPAKIFLGDGGSMPLGFAVAALVANVAGSAEPSSLALLVGFLLVGIPALDTSLVIVSRLRRGVSVLTGGQDHSPSHAPADADHRPGRAGSRGAQALVSTLIIVASREGSSTLVYIVLAFVVFAAAAIVALEDAIPQDSTGAGVRRLVLAVPRTGGAGRGASRVHAWSRSAWEQASARCSPPTTTSGSGYQLVWCWLWRPRWPRSPGRRCSRCRWASR